MYRLKVFKFYWNSSSSINNSSLGLWSAVRMQGSVGDTSPMTGEEYGLKKGSSWASVLAIVCSTEGWTDSTSPTLLVFRGCIRFAGHELVDSSNESSLSKPKCFRVFHFLFDVFGKTCWRTSISGEVDGNCNSLVDGVAINFSDQL